MLKRLFSFLYWKQEIEGRGEDTFVLHDPLRRMYNFQTGEYSYPEMSKSYIIYRRTNTVTGNVKLVKKYLD